MPQRKVRAVRKALSASRRTSHRELADRIDREEAAEIKGLGQRVQARHRRLREAVALLKQERERMKLSLEEVGLRSGIGKANLSRLENNPTANPTLDTLARYAEALGKDVVLTIRDVAPS